MQNDIGQAKKSTNPQDDKSEHQSSGHMTEASELQGFFVVAKAEGKLLGEVSQIFLNPKDKKITALQLKIGLWRRNRHFVPVEAVELLGEDVILVKDLASCKDNNYFDPGWISLKDMQGNWITTLEGAHLGTLIDVDFSPENWVVSHLYLSDHKVMEVNPSEIVFGKDEVVVPSRYSQIIQKQQRPGFLRRLWGEKSFIQMSKIVSRPEKKSNEKKHR